MGYHLTSTQLFEKVLGAIEGFHFDKHASDLPEGMGIGAGACRYPEGASQVLGSPVGLGLRPAVEDLHDVDVGRNAFDCLLTQIAASVVVRMFEVDETSLLLDGSDGFLWRQTLGNGCPQEQADELSFCGQNLLADDDRLTDVPERLRPVDPVVIGQDDRGEAHLATAAGHLQWRHAAVKRSRTVKVEINSDLGAPCASGHVRYYRPEEGSGKGSRQVAPVGWAVGW